VHLVGFTIGIYYDALTYECHIYPCILNPSNAELNPISHLLALLGAHHILYFSRVRVNVATCFDTTVPSSGECACEVSCYFAVTLKHWTCCSLYN
jgi:hypothetical protein